MGVRVLVTGGSGFIGSYLQQLLIERGYDVTGTEYYDGSNFAEPLSPKFEPQLVKCDIRDPIQIKEILNTVRPEIIFHLAAQSFPAISYIKPVDTLMTNVIGTVNLMEGIKEQGLDSKVVMACSSAEYGTLAGDTPITEDVPLMPLHPYGVSKVAQDLLGYVYFKSFGMKCIRVRLFNTTGPGKTGDVCSDFTRQVVLAEHELSNSVIEVGNLRTSRDISDVRDIVKGLVLLAQVGEPGEVYNLCSSVAYSVSDILDMILTKSCANIKYKVVREKFRPVDEPIILGNNQKVRDLGWSPEISFEQTLADMLNYWRGERY